VRTVLVTGGAGFIGHHLVRELIAGKNKVIILDNFSNNNEHFTNELEGRGYIKKKVFLYKQDIRVKQAVLDIFRLETIDACIHLAAKISVQDSISQPLGTINVNIIGTLNVLQACCDAGIENFVLASSAAVYGHPKELPILEDHVTNPLSPYGASKVAGEALVSAYSSKIPNCQILRFFNVYGEGQTSTYAGVITRFAERLSKGLRPVIYGKGNQSRDFIHVNDVVRGIISSLETTGDANDGIGNPRIINIGTGKWTSILDLAHIMIGIFGLQGEIEPKHADVRTGDIIHSYPNIERARKLLGFSAKEELRSGLIKLLKQ
jgi:UDP-glucose 4-epimerase